MRKNGALVLSRHSHRSGYPWNVEACNLNAWCKVPGSPFSAGLFLMPNHPDREQVSVTFGPFELPEPIDTFTFLLSSPAREEHENRIDVDLEILDASRAPIGEAHACLAFRERTHATLALEARNGGPVYLRAGVSFAQFLGSSNYGTASFWYTLAYERNRLADLFNAAGSDKGTEPSVARGVPHCYALDYERLFAPFREESFNLLEIGLEDASKDTGRPTDAPSLRVWREFFPRAGIYGYDINDFSFFDQRSTWTFRGDQSSRADLTSFLGRSGAEFRIVVDDGSHASSHQQVSLATLFPRLEPAGAYVIEDLNWQPFEESPTTLDVLRGFAESGRIESRFIESSEARQLEETIDRIEIYRPNDSEFAVVYKKG